jgi:hypothetical protein
MTGSETSVPICLIASRLDHSENFTMASPPNQDDLKPPGMFGPRDFGQPRITTYMYDSSGRIVASISPGPSFFEEQVTIQPDGRTGGEWLRPGEESPPTQVDHDREKKLFRITGTDGKTEYFRDAPVRFLVVEPDPRTGEMKPAMLGGRPKYLYLCREEREPR